MDCNGIASVSSSADKREEEMVNRKAKKLKNETDIVNKEQQTSCFSRISNINDLPFEILCHIFSYLNIKERIGVERVCKQWRLIGTKSWSDIRVLNPKMLIVFGKKVKKIKLLKILQRCSSSLRELDIDFYALGIKKFPIEICAYCPNLTSISFRNVAILTIEAAMLMVKVWKNITKISFPLEFNAPQEMLELCLCHLLKSYDVEYLDLSDNYSISGVCFCLLKDCLKTLILNGCEILTENFEDIKRLKGLRNLQMDWCESICSSSLINVVKSLESTLVELRLGGDFNDCYKQTFVDIAYHCKNIQLLNFADNTLIDDDVVHIISQTCRLLRFLDISGTRVTNESLRYLTKLLLLQHLCVNLNDSITNDGLRDISVSQSLQQIELQHCSLVGNQGVIDLVTNCRTLKVLNLWCSDNVTDSVLDTLFQLPREKSQVLDIIAGHTGIVRFGYDNSIRVLYKIYEERFLSYRNEIILM